MNIIIIINMNIIIIIIIIIMNMTIISIHIICSIRIISIFTTSIGISRAAGPHARATSAGQTLHTRNHTNVNIHWNTPLKSIAFR